MHFHIFNVNSYSNGASPHKAGQNCLQPPLKTVGFSMMLYFSVCAGLEEHIIYLLKG